MRVMSRLPVAVVVAEPHPDPSLPGNSPALKQTVLRPGLNEVDDDLFGAWTAEAKDGSAAGPGRLWLATPDQIKTDDTDGRVYAMAEDESEREYGFEVALKRAVDAIGADASEGSTVKDPGPVPAEVMRTGSADAAPVASVLAAATPLKVPATSDATAAPMPAKPAASSADATKK